MEDAGNLVYVKRLNRVRVLNIIRENQNTSRNELARLTGLTAATISGIVREMVELGYVEEIGLGRSIGGRRPIRLRFHPESGYVVGVEITRTLTTVGIVDLQAKPVKVVHTSLNMTNPKTGITTLLKQLEEFIASTGIPQTKIMGAGFAFPGLLNQQTKVIHRSTNLGEQWSNIPVKDWLAEHLGIPLFIENNSNAAALAEKILGQGKQVNDLAYINLGEGFSAGVIINGGLVYGSHGFAGELGHQVIVEDGPLCNCGNKGCLESLYAVPALVRKANSELVLCKDNDPLKLIWAAKGEVNIEDILNTCVEVNSYAWELLQQAGAYIGIGIANIINVLNPALICLGGILGEASPIMLDTLIGSVQRHANPEIVKATKIVTSLIGREAAFYGACLGAINQLFDLQDPTILHRAGLL
ncbi:MAG: ROK family protein [Desulfitobacteriaceae bacterium]